jgi:hypothetical protein
MEVRISASRDFRREDHRKQGRLLISTKPQETLPLRCPSEHSSHPMEFQELRYSGIDDFLPVFRIPG